MLNLAKNILMILLLGAAVGILIYLLVRNPTTFTSPSSATANIATTAATLGMVYCLNTVNSFVL